MLCSAQSRYSFRSELIMVETSSSYFPLIVHITIFPAVVVMLHERLFVGKISSYFSPLSYGCFAKYWMPPASG
jgi:hypothetical protein